MCQLESICDRRLMATAKKHSICRNELNIDLEFLILYLIELMKYSVYLELSRNNDKIFRGLYYPKLKKVFAFCCFNTLF